MFEIEQKVIRHMSKQRNMTHCQERKKIHRARLKDDLDV